MSQTPAATQSSVLIPLDQVLARATCLSLRLWFALMGLHTFIYHWVIIPFYFIRVVASTITAYVLDRSFVVRRPRYPPRFIARPSSQDIHTFSLLPEDINLVCDKTAINVRAFRFREWIPVEQVRHLIQPNPDHPEVDPLADAVDLTTFRLAGPRLRQGQGIIGHGVRLAMIREIGRYPDDEENLLVETYSWEMGRVVFAKVPIRFVATPGVNETVDLGNAKVRFIWMDLEKGMVEGPHMRVEVTGVSEDIGPVFAAFANDSGVELSFME